MIKISCLTSQQMIDQNLLIHFVGIDVAVVGAGRRRSGPIFQTDQPRFAHSTFIQLVCFFFYAQKYSKTSIPVGVEVHSELVKVSPFMIPSPLVQKHDERKYLPCCTPAKLNPMS